MAFLYRYIFRGIGILFFIGVLTALYSAFCTISEHPLASPSEPPFLIQ